MIGSEVAKSLSCNQNCKGGGGRGIFFFPCTAVIVNVFVIGLSPTRRELKVLSAVCLLERKEAFVALLMYTQIHLIYYVTV